MNEAKAVPAPSRGARWRRRLRWPMALLALMAFVTVDLGPSIPRPPPPNGKKAEQTRDLFRQTRTLLGQSGARANLRYTAEELQSGAALGSALGSFGRFDTGLEDDRLTLRASRNLLGPLWVNVRARVSPSKHGFPPVALTIGRLPLGATMSRWLIETGRVVLRGRGVRIPELDRLVDGMAIKNGAVTANVYFPSRSGISRGIAGLRYEPVDPKAAARIYCRLVGLQARAPTADFTEVVRRAFAAPRPTSDIVEANRASFVALASYTVGSGAMRLADGMQRYAGTCSGARMPAYIAGRADLPMHWSLSAALSVAIGDDVSKAMGEWKELADSRPSGSGFSFVDLAADRAGISAAKAATDPGRAATLARRLQSATADSIIPVRALALSEGLTEAEFVARYGTIESEAFANATARIDRVIARTAGE